MTTQIQSVLFPLKWSTKEIDSFLSKMKIRRIKAIHRTDNYKRARILQPNFKSYRTKKLSNGIVLVIGIK